MRKNYSFAIVILILGVAVYSASLEVVVIPSLYMQKNFKASVITPCEYGKNKKRFSVIYFLHGYGGDYSTWPGIASLKEYSDKYQLIFICPDGNRNSWYIDSPFKKNSRFETYIAKEVVGFADAHYRTWSKCSGRAITGSSMGGHGAMTIIAKNPDVFCGAGSISGILDLTAFPEQWDLPEVLGNYDLNPEIWRKNSFTGLLENLKGKNKALIIDCGTMDFALPVNLEVHEMLNSLNISHEYINRPGNHSYVYCAKNVESVIRYLNNVLEQPGYE
ncbi:MAG TPA: XynC protein [Fibrobacteres bacterium]|nr:XynC protein [Fibrobacterota bacterium]